MKVAIHAHVPESNIYFSTNYYIFSKYKLMETLHSLIFIVLLYILSLLVLHSQNIESS